MTIFVRDGGNAVDSNLDRVLRGDLADESFLTEQNIEENIYLRDPIFGKHITTVFHHLYLYLNEIQKKRYIISSKYKVGTTFDQENQYNISSYATKIINKVNNLLKKLTQELINSDPARKTQLTDYFLNLIKLDLKDETQSLLLPYSLQAWLSDTQCITAFIELIEQLDIKTVKEKIEFLEKCNQSYLARQNNSETYFYKSHYSDRLVQLKDSIFELAPNSVSDCLKYLKEKGYDISESIRENEKNQENKFESSKATLCHLLELTNKEVIDFIEEAFNNENKLAKIKKNGSLQLLVLCYMAAAKAKFNFDNFNKSTQSYLGLEFSYDYLPFQLDKLGNLGCHISQYKATIRKWLSDDSHKYQNALWLHLASDTNTALGKILKEPQHGKQRSSNFTKICELATQKKNNVFNEFLILEDGKFASLRADVLPQIPAAIHLSEGTTIKDFNLITLHPSVTKETSLDVIADNDENPENEFETSAILSHLSTLTNKEVIDFLEDVFINEEKLGKIKESGSLQLLVLCYMAACKARSLDVQFKDSMASPLGMNFTNKPFELGQLSEFDKYGSKIIANKKTLLRHFKSSPCTCRMAVWLHVASDPNNSLGNILSTPQPGHQKSSNFEEICRLAEEQRGNFFREFIMMDNSKFQRFQNDLLPTKLSPSPSVGGSIHLTLLGGEKKPAERSQVPTQGIEYQL